MPKTAPQGNHRYTFSSGARPLDGYTIRRAIGRGGFGEVYYATSDSGKEVALKLILHNLEVERRGVVQCMNLKCPNLLTIHDLKSNDAGENFVIMEFVAGPSLANVLAQHPRGLPAADVRAWLKGLIDGVAYLHDHGIVHRDLKPANMFMEEGIVKIGDYGLAKLINAGPETGHSESIGTCHYMAPEIASGKYHKPIDVYAIGVILYEMLSGRVPFEGESVGEILMKHLTARADLSRIPEPYRAIVGRALAKDPAQRPSRLEELLPREDAPRVPPLRFLGEGQGAPELVMADEEEIHRIVPEEPVFYIGPDTQPPRRRPPPSINQRLRDGWSTIRRPPQRTPAPAPAPRPAPAQAARPRPRPAAPPVPATPPPLPSGRIRVAELATALLWAAALTAIFAIGAAALFGVDLTRSPRQLVELFVLTLLGSWTVLTQNKALEGRDFDSNTRRLLDLLLGALVGGTGLWLENWLRPGTGIDILSLRSDPARFLSTAGAAVPFTYLSYFGLLFLANGGWKSLAARDRKAKFRILPVLGTGALATILLPLWPTAEPRGVAIAVSIAVITQLVSPWDASAAAYARAHRGRRQVA